MKGFLIDTSILSILAPDRPPVPLPLRHWIVSQGAQNMLFTSSIVILEVRRGIAKLKRTGGGARAQRLEDWLTSLMADFQENTLPVDSIVAGIAGDMEDAAIARGNSPGLADVLIAATASAHGLTVLTSNVRHFDRLGVEHLDPLTSPLPT